MKNGDFVNGAHSNDFDEETDDLRGMTFYRAFIAFLAPRNKSSRDTAAIQRGFFFADRDSVQCLADRSQSKYYTE
jgi:hypothetical protein